MPAHRLPRLRRPVAVLCALLLSLVAAVLGPTSTAAADPFLGDGPQLILPSDVTFVLGRPGDSYTIEADGDPVPTIAVDTLPSGLRFVAHGDGTGTISGTPLGPPGETEVVVRARSSAGSSSAVLTLAVQQAPGFEVATPVVLPAGRYGSVLVRTTGYPAPGIGLDGDLPAGLTFLDHGDGTATISGTALSPVPLSVPVTLTAVNVVADVALSTTVEVVVEQQPTVDPMPSTPAGFRPGRPDRDPDGLPGT